MSKVPTNGDIIGETSLTGSMLQEIRHNELGMTQGRLAEVLGVSKPTIARYEGRKDWELPKLFSWAFGGVVYHHRLTKKDAV